MLAVGGGSVIDCSKAIAAAALYDGDAWDLITHKAPTLGALPVISVLTLSATGSEYDWGAVISRPETNDKVGYIDPHLFPLCPCLIRSLRSPVSAYQTAAGAADIMNHVIEQFFTGLSSFLADNLCASVLKTVIKYASSAIKNPRDYEARAQLMWASSLGCNGILSLGSAASGWPCHGIEHALSGHYDITHGVGLAIVTPRWMKHILSEKTLERFVSFGRLVFGIDERDDRKTAEKAIDATYDFFKSIGIPMTLGEVGIDEKRIGEMAAHIANNEGLDKAYAPLSENDIEEILKACL